MDMYAEEIISHYEHPHNKGVIKNPDVSFHEHNATCGDDITVYLEIDGKKVNDVKFDGSGCAISMAAASMLTDEIKGKDLATVESMGFKELVELIGIDPGPARLKCATLSLKAVKKALFLYQHKTVDQGTKDM